MWESSNDLESVLWRSGDMACAAGLSEKQMGDYSDEKD
jgi:hypothetical protein